MAPSGWVNFRGQRHSQAAEWDCGRCKTAGNWDSRQHCRSCGTARPAPVAGAARSKAGPESKSEPTLPAWTKQGTASNPTPAEAARRGKGGSSSQPARPLSKVEKLQAQALLYEGDPESFSEELLAFIRVALETAKAERDGGKPTLNRLTEAQNLLAKRRRALVGCEKTVEDLKERMEKAVLDVDRERAAIEAQAQEVGRLQDLFGEENAEASLSRAGRTQPDATVQDLFVQARADEFTAFRKEHEAKMAEVQPPSSQGLGEVQPDDADMLGEFTAAGGNRGRKGRAARGAGEARRTSRSRSGGRNIDEVAAELRAAAEGVDGMGSLDGEARDKLFKTLAENLKKMRAGAGSVPGLEKSG